MLKVSTATYGNHKCTSTPERMRTQRNTHIFGQTCTNIYTKFIHVDVCVYMCKCMCVCSAGFL